MFDVAIILLTELIACVPVYVAVVLVFNIISDLLFNK